MDKLNKWEKYRLKKYKPHCKTCGQMIMDAKQKHRKYCKSCKEDRAKAYVERCKKKKEERK